VSNFFHLLDFAAYKKNKKKLFISLCYCSKYISSIKNKKKERKEKEKKNRSKRRLLDSTAEN
jgi:hypothetical protein